MTGEIHVITNYKVGCHILNNGILIGSVIQILTKKQKRNQLILLGSNAKTSGISL